MTIRSTADCNTFISSVFPHTRARTHTYTHTLILWFHWKVREISCK